MMLSLFADAVYSVTVVIASLLSAAQYCKYISASSCLMPSTVMYGLNMSMMALLSVTSVVAVPKLKPISGAGGGVMVTSLLHAVNIAVAANNIYRYLFIVLSV